MKIELLISLTLPIHSFHAVYFYSNKLLPSHISYLHTQSFAVFGEHVLEYINNKFFLLSVMCIDLRQLQYVKLFAGTRSVLPVQAHLKTVH